MDEINTNTNETLDTESAGAIRIRELRRCDHEKDYQINFIPGSRAGAGMRYDGDLVRC